MKGRGIIGLGGGVGSSLERSMPYCLKSKVSNIPNSKLLEVRFGPDMMSKISLGRFTGIKDKL